MLDYVLLQATPKLCDLKLLMIYFCHEFMYCYMFLLALDGLLIYIQSDVGWVGDCISSLWLL